MTGWPGQWHSKGDDGATIADDHEWLLMAGNGPEEYLWYNPGSVSTYTAVER
jgi:hypothetical protein